MVERRVRRKPLVLASTQALLDSLAGDRRPRAPPPEPLRLKAGIPRFSSPSASSGGDEFGELASLVALSASALRRLAIVTDTTDNFGMENYDVIRMFSRFYKRKFCSQVEGQHNGGSGGSHLCLHLELLPWPQVPKHALHLWVSVVRVPECGVLASLNINSASGSSDYQDMIDQALNDYFRCDRFLARGDVFCVQNNWNCGVSCCRACNKENDKLYHRNMIHFKVTGMEPSDESIFRVSCNQTTLVLGEVLLRQFLLTASLLLLVIQWSI